MPATRVLIVDSHPIIADSLSAWLEDRDAFAAMACRTYTEVPACVESFHPEIIVINIHLETVQEGLGACREITQIPGNQAIVMIAPRSLVESDTLALDALEAGADGVLISEDLDLYKLVKALEDLEAGRSLLDSGHLREALALRSAALPSPAGMPLDLSELTPREQDVAELIISGSSTNEIAEQLSISDRTVQNHISNLLTKLNVRTRAEAVARLYMWRHAQTQTLRPSE
jgi:DNA-binding NarL/FixJ family response regulator